MIPKRLDQIDAADLDALITDQVREGRTIRVQARVTWRQG